MTPTRARLHRVASEQDKMYRREAELHLKRTAEEKIRREARLHLHRVKSSREKQERKRRQERICRHVNITKHFTRLVKQLVGVVAEQEREIDACQMEVDTVKRKLAMYEQISEASNSDPGERSINEEQFYETPNSDSEYEQPHFDTEAQIEGRTSNEAPNSDSEDELSYPEPRAPDSDFEDEQSYSDDSEKETNPDSSESTYKAYR